MLVIVGGVSGSGKSTIGKLLSEKLKLPFYDGDDFHPQSNIEKMANGQALTDQDRQPWLQELAENLSIWQKQGGAVLACSALKESYRKTLSSIEKDQIHWVILTASEALLKERLANRRDHFFDQRLLDTQLAALETPDYGLVIDVASSVEETVEQIIKAL